MNGNGLQSSSGSFSISSSEHEHNDLLNSSHSNLATEDAEDNDEEGDTSSVTLPLEVEIQIKDTVPTSIYICEVCQKDKRDYNTLGEHRKHVHKLPWRQERLGPYVSALAVILIITSLHRYFFYRGKSHPMIYILNDNL